MKRSGPPKRKTPLKSTGFTNRGEGPKRSGWPLRRRKPIAPMSEARRAEIEPHRAIREAVFERDGRRCRIAPFLPDTKCFGPPTVHHRLKASQGGAYDEDNLITACAWHNDWVEDHPAEALALGLVIRPRATDG